MSSLGLMVRRAMFVRLLRALTVASLIGALATVVSADNTDPRNIGAKYGWGENVGWISARPSSDTYGPGGTGMQVSDTDVTGYLWGENIGWINLSCLNDTSCGGAAGAWGVKNDGLGHLSGYAWAENAGWISFSCNNNPASCGSTGNYGVNITNYNIVPAASQRGLLQGYAWGENIGWISFSCANSSSCASVNYGVQTGAPDSDGDGCRDPDEAPLTLDQWNPWDFYSVPVPALFIARNPASTFRDGSVVPADAQAIFAYFQKAAATGTPEYEQDLDANGIKDGLQYDRSLVGPGKSGPPDGTVTAADANLAFAQWKLQFTC